MTTVSVRRQSIQTGLRILATSDLHAHMTGRDFTKMRTRSGIGLAALAPVIAAARAEADNSLFLDNGDLIEGTALGEEAATADGPHPMIAALNHLGCDAATLGNHDFGFGLEATQRIYAQADFPVLSANLTDPSGSTIWPGHCLLQRQLSHAGGQTPITIGLFGVLPPQVLQWERRNLAGRAAAQDILAAARATLPRLRAAGAEIIIALCHSGIAETADEGAEDAALQVAALDGVDAVIAGHKHRRFPGPDHSGTGIAPEEGRLAGVPAVMPGWRGSHLGVIDLCLSHSAAEGWRITGARSALRQASDQPDPGIAALGASEEAAAERRLAAPIGQSAEPLHSYFAHLPDAPALTCVARAARAHTQARVAAEGQGAGLPVVAAVAAHKAGGFGGPGNYADVPAGPVALRHVHDLFPYENTIAAFQTTGATLLDWLERAASVFSQIRPGSRGTALLRPGVYPGIFHHFEGVSFQLDLAADGLYCPDAPTPTGQTPRIRDATLAGEPLTAQTPLILVTNDHRIWGGGGVPAAPGDSILIDGPQTMREVVAHHLSTRYAAPKQAPSWRFAPLDARVRYATSPKAEAHVGELDHMEVEGTELGADGFLWITLAI